MRLTGDAVEYHADAPDLPHAETWRPPHERRRPLDRATPSTALRGRVTQRRVVRSEWTKLWTLRSTRWSLLAAVVAMVGARDRSSPPSQMSRWTHLDAARARALRLDRHRRRRLPPRPAGHRRARRAGDHRRVLTGMIRSSLMAVPRRLPVLWAKLGVFARRDVRADARRVARVVLRRAGDRRVSITSQHALGDPHALRVVVGTALFLTVLGVLGVGARRAGPQHRRRHRALRRACCSSCPGSPRSCRAASADAIGPYLPLNAGTRWRRARSTTRTTSRRGPASPCSAATPRWRSPRPPCGSARDA